MGVSQNPTLRCAPAALLGVLLLFSNIEMRAQNGPTFSDANWSTMNPSISGANGPVDAAVVDGAGNLCIGGDFTAVGDVIANVIAKWNGLSWTAMGSGMNERVLALAVSGSDLYAGGQFAIAGNRVSANVARAYLPALPALSVLRSDTQVTVSWASADTTGFGLEQAGALAAPASWVTNSAIITEDGTNKSVTIPVTNAPQFFRLRRP